MKRDQVLTIASLILGILGLLAAILAGIFGQRTTSLVILAILVVGWLVWLTSRVLVLSQQKQRPASSNIGLRETRSLPYEVYYKGFERQIKLIKYKTDKIKIPPVFLSWPRFTLVFWVRITEEFFNTHNNRYLFSYTTDVHDSSDYPNAFFLGLRYQGKQWEFHIKGEDPKNSNKIVFESGGNLVGWKLFSIRWDCGRRNLDFSIDAKHVFSAKKNIPDSHWPKASSDCLFHLGGWQDGWDGGLSLLYFYNFRVYERYLSSNDIETLFENEGTMLSSLD